MEKSNIPKNKAYPNKNKDTITKNKKKREDNPDIEPTRAVISSQRSVNDIELGSRFGGIPLVLCRCVCAKKNLLDSSIALC